MAKSDIPELKGHHLSYLAEWLHEKEQTEQMAGASYDNYSSVSVSGYGIDSLLSNKPADLGAWEKSFRGDALETGHALFERLYSSPDMSIRVANVRLDAICSVCKRKDEPRCADISEEDVRALEDFGLEDGTVYSAQEILEAIRTYQEHTGRVSPRTLNGYKFEKLD